MSFEETDTILIFTSAALTVTLVFFFLIIILRNYKKNANKQLDDIRLIFETQEKERERIARDLHEGIGALLSAAKLHSSLLVTDDKDDELTEAANNIANILDKAVGDLRLIVRNLVPHNFVDKGWVAALHELKNQINSGKQQQVSIISDEKILRYEIETEMNLFRIVQELINNSIKHSGASEILVKIEKDPEYLTIDAQDNGIGIQLNKMENGYGIKNIHARLNAFKGNMEVLNEKGGGARFIVRFETKNLKDRK